MTLSLYSTYKAWRREIDAGRIEAAARRVIEPAASVKRTEHDDMGNGQGDHAQIGIG